MKSMKRLHPVFGVILGLLVLNIAFPGLSSELRFLTTEYGQTQEKLGKDIREASWLNWNKGRIQEELGRFIQAGAVTGQMSQESIGSGITATAMINFQLARVAEQIEASVTRAAQILSEDGAMVAEAAEIRQVAMKQAIQKQGQIDGTMAQMAGSLYATLQGREAAPISEGMILDLHRVRAFKQVNDFNLALRLLENERGASLMALMPQKTQVVSSSSQGASSMAMDTFVDFGLFALSAFGFTVWAFYNLSADIDHQTLAEEEAPWEYPEAA